MKKEKNKNREKKAKSQRDDKVSLKYTNTKNKRILTKVFVHTNIVSQIKLSVY